MPRPVCAIYYNPVLVITNHLSKRDATKIQEMFKEKIPAINSEFIFAIMIRQNNTDSAIVCANNTKIKED